MDLQEHFDKIIESRIKDYHWDILGNILCMTLILLEDGQISNHQIEFKEVSCLYFVNNNFKRRKDIVPVEDGDYLELTNVNLLTHKTSLSLESEEDLWLSQFSGEGNVVLEIWNKLLILECSQIEIDNQIYDV